MKILKLQIVYNNKPQALLEIGKRDQNKKRIQESLEAYERAMDLGENW